MKYHLSSRIIHWSMALLIIFMLGLGNYMGLIPKDAPNRMEIYSLHKSLGVIALIFIFIRIVNRFFKKPPALPTTMKKTEIILAHLGHLSLYLLMIAVPLSGYLMSNSSGYSVHLFTVEMPILMSANFKFAALFHEAHEISAKLLILVLALHIFAAIKHRFFDKPENDVLKRIL